ncbi:DUF4352 domain-containing protein [Streptomyces sp. NPDC058701]|uniref:DUF4352 domain-containing protein n=1 Tax=Streptomyces sp. NPDC058701 TaxID=3346608 RepID=UPI00364AB9EA
MGKIVGFGCLGVLGLFILLGIVVAVVGGDAGDTTSKPPVASQPAGGESAPASKVPEKKVAVAVVAKKAAFKKSIIAQGGAYTTVSVTVTNNSSKPINVNPLYFAITDANGAKYAAELGADENQIATVELAPGENVTGAVTGKGTFTAKSVTYTDGLIGDSVRADVS